MTRALAVDDLDGALGARLTHTPQPLQSSSVDVDYLPRNRSLT